jgi:hypothetical protein
MMKDPDRAANKLDLRPYRKAINRVRAIVFINTLIIAAKIKREPSSLMRWGQDFERQFLGFRCDDPSMKWRRYLRGVLVAPGLRAALCKRFTIVFMVLINPLWGVLFQLEAFSHELDKLLRLGAGKLEWRKLHERNRRIRERLAGSIQSDDHYLDKCSLKHWQPIAYSDWGCLCFALVILWSRSSRLEAQRVWLSRRFSQIFLLVCLHPEMTGATRLLFQIVDRLIRQVVLCPVRGWPSSLQQFKRRLKNLRRLVFALQRQCGMTENQALKMVHAMFIDLDNVAPRLTDEDVCAPRMPINFCSPKLAPLFKRCRKQMRRKNGRYFSFKRWKLDVKAVQGWKISTI